MSKNTKTTGSISLFSAKIVLSIFLTMSLTVIKAQPNSTMRYSGHEIYVAASDSHPTDKEKADIVCDGDNDQDDLQRAINALGSCGIVHLAAGNYRVDAFTKAINGPDYAIKTNINSKVKLIGVVRANGSIDYDKPRVNGVRILVTKKCYASLDSKRQYAVICGDDKDDFGEVMSQELTIKGLSVILPDNQKNIICIDGYHLGALNVDEARVGTYYMNRGLGAGTNFHIGVPGCIGIRGLQGSNNGSETIFRSIYAIGLGIGFDLSGEHLVCIQLGAIGNRYGYRFSAYSPHKWAWCHPITLINCCDEVSANYPLFGPNELHQAVNLINFNIEHYTNIFTEGGEYAREAVPGQWRGNIDYDIQDWEYDITNSPYRRFWAADGSGSGTISRNNAHTPTLSTKERHSFAATIGQTVIDTDLNRTATCLRPGTYAAVKFNIRKTNNSKGTIAITVGRNTRKIAINELYSNTKDLARHIFKNIFSDTSCNLDENNAEITIFNQEIGKIKSSEIQFLPGDTGIEGNIEIYQQGSPNIWIDGNGKTLK